MRSVKLILMSELLILFGLAMGCSPSNIDSSTPGTGGGGGGGGTSTASALSVSAASPTIQPSASTAVTAHVVDTLGNNVPDGTVVKFSFAAGDQLKASLSAASATTANGLATVTVTATSTTSTIAVVNASSGAATGSVSITIQQGGGGGGTVAVTSSLTSITVGNSTTITATVKDGTGALLPNVSVNFSLNNNTLASLSLTSATTNTNGAATTILTGTNAGTVTVTATVLSLGSITGQTSVTINPAATVPTLTVTATSSSILTNAATTINAALTGFGSNPVSGLTINFTVNNASAATLSAASAVTNGSGVATITLTAKNIVTPVTVTATYTGTPVTPAGTTTITITSPPPDTVSLAANPASITVYGTTTLTATVTGAGQNVPDGTLVSFILSDSTYGSLSSSTGSTVNGKATTTFVAVNKAGSVSISAVAGSVSSSTTLNISPAATGSIQFVSANPQVIGISGSASTTQSTVTFSVLDVNGKPVADGTPVIFSMTGPGGGAYIGPIAGSTTATASTVNGSVSVLLQSGKTAGPVTIIASTFVNSASSTTLAAAIDSLVTTIPAASTAGFPATGTIKIDSELITYTGTTGASFTGCSRGAVGTSASAHASGATVYGQTTISSSANQISIGGGVPSATHFNLATSQFNLPGLAVSGKQATISAYIADRFGNYNILQGDTVSYYPEAGAIISSTVTDATGLSTATFRTQSPMPAQVRIWGASDPRDEGALLNYLNTVYGWTFPTTAPAGNAVHPRNGWVSVIAAVQGEESFLDENGDGLFTRSASTSPCPAGYTCECDNGSPNTYAGCITSQPDGYAGCSPATTCAAAGGSIPANSKRSEAFKDIGEPFIDVNDDGCRNDGNTKDCGGATSADTDPFELFVDANNNGAYDPPNGLWDGPDCNNTNSACLRSKMIWAPIKLAFTGNAKYCTFGPVPLNLNISYGGSGSFSFMVGDMFTNSLPPKTTVAITSSGGTLTGQTTYTVLDGIPFGPTELFFTVVAPTTTPSPYVTTPFTVTATVTSPDVVGCTVTMSGYFQ